MSNTSKPFSISAVCGAADTPTGQESSAEIIGIGGCRWHRTTVYIAAVDIPYLSSTSNLIKLKRHLYGKFSCRISEKLDSLITTKAPFSRLITPLVGSPHPLLITTNTAPDLTLWSRILIQIQALSSWLSTIQIMTYSTMLLAANTRHHSNNMAHMQSVRPTSVRCDSEDSNASNDTIADNHGCAAATWWSVDQLRRMYRGTK